MLASPAKAHGQALEGVVARPVELHGLCLVLGVSIAALGGLLHHVVPVADNLVAAVPLLFGVVAVEEEIKDIGNGDGVKSFPDLFVTRVTIWGDEVHSTKDTVNHRILCTSHWVGIVDCDAHLTDRRTLAIGGLPLFRTSLRLGRSKDASPSWPAILSKVGALLVDVLGLLIELRTSNARAHLHVLSQLVLPLVAPIGTRLLSLVTSMC